MELDDLVRTPDDPQFKLPGTMSQDKRKQDLFKVHYHTREQSKKADKDKPQKTPTHETSKGRSESNIKKKKKVLLGGDQILEV